MNETSEPVSPFYSNLWFDYRKEERSTFLSKKVERNHTKREFKTKQVFKTQNHQMSVLFLSLPNPRLSDSSTSPWVQGYAQNDTTKSVLKQSREVVLNTLRLRSGTVKSRRNDANFVFSNYNVNFYLNIKNYPQARLLTLSFKKL